ncbi:hypothetical protein KEM55_005904 [Ascosphaera atra]|nr:hypothetical protein KEM55_005904 [Ascosphaera atra]
MPPPLSQAPSEISMSPAATQEPSQSVQSVAMLSPSPSQSTQRRGKKRAGSSVPELTKKSRATWTDEATETLLRDVTHMRHTGYSAGSTINSAGWEILRATLKEKHGLDVTQQQIRHRLTKLKEDYNNYKLFCKATSGWGSRTNDGRPTNTEQVMDTFFGQEVHEKFRPYRYRRPMYEDLVFAYVTGSTATGDHARSPEELIADADEEAEAPSSTQRRKNELGVHIENAARILAGEDASMESVGVRREAMRLFAQEKERACPPGWKEDGKVCTMYSTRVMRMFSDEFFASLFVEMCNCDGFDIDEMQLVMMDQYDAVYG